MIRPCYLAQGFTLAAWIFPTRLDGLAQGLLTKSSPDGKGYGLVITESGAVALRVGGREISTGVPLREERFRLSVAQRRDDPPAFGKAGQTRLRAVPSAARRVVAGIDERRIDINPVDSDRR